MQCVAAGEAVPGHTMEELLPVQSTCMCKAKRSEGRKEEEHSGLGECEEPMEIPIAAANEGLDNTHTTRSNA